MTCRLVCQPDSRRFDVVLINPPFGTKGASDFPNSEDFTIETTNKQLNFLQNVLTILKKGGRAAIVLPDNCLFADQAGEVYEANFLRDRLISTAVRLISTAVRLISTAVRLISAVAGAVKLPLRHF